MTFFIQKFTILVWALCLGLLLSCGNKLASTEVPNEIKVSSIQGVAATGYAMANSTWELYTPQGTMLAQGITDTQGRFTASLDTLVDSTKVAWLVRVYNSMDTLFGVFTADSLLRASQTLFGQVNPITDFIVRKNLTMVSGDLGAGYSAPALDSLDRYGALAVRAIFGAGTDWHSFGHDPLYLPAMEAPDSGYVPSPADILLHSLTSEALRLGINRTILLDSLYDDPTFQALGDQGFRLDVATNMVLLGVPPNIATPQLLAWGVAQGIPNDSDVVHHYQNLWQYNQDNGAQGGGADSPVANTMDVSNKAMQMVLGTYIYPNLDTAIQSFSFGSQIISDVIFPLMSQGAFNVKNPRWMKMARSLGFVLASLNPSVWVNDSTSVRNLVQLILVSKVNLYVDTPNDLLTPDSIKGWVDQQWNAATFFVDPRRSDSDWTSHVPPPPVDTTSK